MQLHTNAKLEPADGRELVRLVYGGDTLRAAAAAVNAAPATAHRWWHRCLGPGAVERESVRWASRPRTSPGRTPAPEERRICAARRRTGWRSRPIAGGVGRPRATVSKALAHHGLSRGQGAGREPARRYEWACTGVLLHMDVKR